MALLFACYVAQWTTVMVWLPTFLSEHGASTATAAAATALMVLANIPGNLAGGWLLSHGFARNRLVLTACAIAAACEIGMLSTALPDGLRFGLVLAFSLCAGLIPPPCSLDYRCTRRRRSILPPATASSCSSRTSASSSASRHRLDRVAVRRLGRVTLGLAYAGRGGDRGRPGSGSLRASLGDIELQPWSKSTSAKSDHATACRTRTT
jgi:hypothetical protein